MTSDTHTGAETHILSMKDLVVVRGDQKLIDHVSATVTRGHITLLLGHNGAGKTVLMNCLHGLMTVDSGHIDAPPQAAPEDGLSKADHAAPVSRTIS